VIPGPPQETASSWRFSAGLEIAATSGIASPLAVGSTLFLEAARSDRSTFAFAPSIRLAAIQADSGYLGPAPVVARFQLHLARAELCPVRLRIFEEASIAPCASFDVGTLLAEGWGSAAAGSSLRPWAAPGLGGRLRWAIAGNIELQIEGNSSFPLVRDTFFVAPDIVVNVVPSAAGWLAGGVGVHFF
jgi:hypothetical protein